MAFQNFSSVGSLSISLNQTPSSKYQMGKERPEPGFAQHSPIRASSSLRPAAVGSDLDRARVDAGVRHRGRRPVEQPAALVLAEPDAEAPSGERVERRAEDRGRIGCSHLDAAQERDDPVRRGVGVLALLRLDGPDRDREEGVTEPPVVLVVRLPEIERHRLVVALECSLPQFVQCAEIVVAGGAAPEFLRRDGVVDGGQRRRRVRGGVIRSRGRGGEGEEGEEEGEAFHCGRGRGQC